MTELMEAVTEALNLDTQGATDKALDKYLDCLEILAIGAAEIDDQTATIASNCLQRIRDITQPNQRKGSTSIDVSLSSARRHHENEHMQQRHHKRSSSLTLSPYGGQYHQKQSLFQQRVRELLSVREERRERLSGSRVIDWMRSAFANIDFGALTSVLSRPPFTISTAEEQAILNALGSSSNESLLQAAVLKFLNKQKSHPVVQLVDDFVRRLAHLLAGQAKGPDGEPGRMNCQEVADEIHLFSRHFCTWFSQQWGVQAGVGVELGLQEYLFGTAVYHLLISSYSTCEKRSMKLTDLGWEKLVETLGISVSIDGLEVFPVSVDPLVLHSALSCLATIPAARTPIAKLSCLLKACTDICKALPDDEIGGEELMRLLSLVIIRSPIGTLMHAEARFIADLVPESVLRGESGYVLATLQSALDFIEQV